MTETASGSNSASGDAAERAARLEVGDYVAWPKDGEELWRREGSVRRLRGEVAIVACSGNRQELEVALADLVRTESPVERRARWDDDRSPF